MSLRLMRGQKPDSSLVHLLIRIVPMIMVMGTIFFLSHQSGDSLKLPFFPGADKLAHMLAYGILALSVFWYQGERVLTRPLRTAVLTVLFCVLYGVSDEYHQFFIPLRSASGFDILADTAGAVCVSIVWLKNAPLRRKMVCWQEIIIKKSHYTISR